MAGSMSPLNNLPVNLLKLTLQKIPLGLSIFDSRGVIKFSNQSYADHYNVVVNEILNKSAFSLIPGDITEKLPELFNQHPPTYNTSLQVEQKILRNNRKIKWLKSTFVIENTEQNKLIFHFVEDVTSKRQLEMEIKEKANHYKTVFNNTNDAIFICYLNYGKTLSNFFDVNLEAIKRLEFTKNEYLEMSPSTLFFEKNEPKEIEFVDKLLKDRMCIFTTNLHSKNKKTRISEINSYLFDYESRQAIIFIARDLSERKRYESELLKSGENLRNLAIHLQSIREEERKNISREIHDELGQVLTVLKIQTSLLEKKISPDHPELKDKFSSIANIIDSSVESVQKICEKLRPGILDDLGLLAAMEWQVDEFSKRTKINCILDLPDEDIVLESEKKIAVFRIFQEALTNAARHSNASKIKLSMKLNYDKLILTIKDNGKGITQNQVNNPRSLGILGMKERALILGGNLDIRSTMGSGTLVNLELPISE